MPSSLDSYTYALFFNDAGYNSGWGSYNWVSQTRLQRIKDYMDGKISYTTIHRMEATPGPTVTKKEMTI